MKSFDIIIVGAGHNGLAASIKLAKTGRKVLLLETSSEPGGIAASKEIFNGFKTATLPHIVNQLSSKAIKELDLLKYGLETRITQFLRYVLTILEDTFNYQEIMVLK